MVSYANMKSLDDHRNLAHGTIERLCKEWEQHLVAKSKEVELLRGDLDDLQKKLELKDQETAQLHEKNLRLRDEVARLQSGSASKQSAAWAALVEEHRNLLREHERQKALALANEQELLQRLKKDRQKLKSWTRFSGLDARSKSSTDATKAGMVPGTLERIRKPASPSKDLVMETFGSTERCTHDGRSGHPRASRLDMAASAKTFTAEPYSSAQQNWVGSSNVPDRFPIDRPLPAQSLSSSRLSSAPPQSRFSEVNCAPQIAARSEHSSSTAPPSGISPTAAASVSDPVKAYDSDSPQFLGSRTIKKRGSAKRRSYGDVPVVNEASIVTIKSESDVNLDSTKLELQNLVEQATDECLDPPSSSWQQQSHNQEGFPVTEDSNGVGPPSSIQNIGHRHNSAFPIDISDNPRLPPSKAKAKQDKDDAPLLNHPRPLRQLDPNLRQQCNTPRQIIPSKRKSDESRKLAAIADISEDGENYICSVGQKVAIPPHRTDQDGAATCSTSEQHNRLPTSSSTASTVHQRLDDLLQRKPPTHNTIQLSSLPPPLPSTSSLQPPSSAPTAQQVEEMDECLWSASLYFTGRARRSFDQIMAASKNDIEADSKRKDWQWWKKACDLLLAKNMRCPDAESREAPQRESISKQPWKVAPRRWSTFRETKINTSKESTTSTAAGTTTTNPPARTSSDSSDLLNQIRRRSSRYDTRTRPKTPPGFWAVDFPASSPQPTTTVAATAGAVAETVTATATK